MGYPLFLMRLPGSPQQHRERASAVAAVVHAIEAEGGQLPQNYPDFTAADGSDPVAGPPGGYELVGPTVDGMLDADAGLSSCKFELRGGLTTWFCDVVMRLSIAGGMAVFSEKGTMIIPAPLVGTVDLTTHLTTLAEDGWSGTHVVVTSADELRAELQDEVTVAQEYTRRVTRGVRP